MHAALRTVLLSDPIDQWAKGAIHAWDFQRGLTRFNGQRWGNMLSTPGMNFTRASPQVDYAQSLDGKWSSFGIGSPRITDNGILLESARTNLLTYARDFTNAAWTKTNVTAALTQTGILGDANSASLLTATNTNGTCFQAVTSASAARATTCFVKRVTGSGAIEFTTDGGSTYTAITASLSTGQWYRAEIRQTVTNPSVGFRIGTNTDAIAVDFAQLESANGASSPILTTTASVTRAADAATVTAAVAYPLTMFCRFICPTVFANNQTGFHVDDGDGTDKAALYRDLATGEASLSIVSGNVIQAAYITGGAMAAGATCNMAARVQTNDSNMVFNGVAQAADTAVTLPAEGSRILFGSGVGTGPLFGYLQRAAIWNRALTDADMKALTLLV